MSLRSEAKEAMAKMAEARGYVETPVAIRAEDWTARDCFGPTLAVAQAVLAVIDEYEEVTLCENKHCPGLWYAKGMSGFDAEHAKHLHVFLRRKQKPKPDVTELARRAVKEWKRRYGDAEPLSDAMHALAEAVDE